MLELPCGIKDKREIHTALSTLVRILLRDGYSTFSQTEAYSNGYFKFYPCYPVAEPWNFTGERMIVNFRNSKGKEMINYKSKGVKFM